jgi:hypothetical protein
MKNWYRIVKRSDRIEDVGARLDAMGHDERVKAVRSMCAHTQALLWEMAEGSELSLDHFVPPEVPPLTEVIHFGKNSMPAFSSFEKRFARPAPGGDGATLLGYNEGVLRPVVGPGYFMVRETPRSSKGPVVIDYYATPRETVPSWPAIATKDWGLPALVYGFMHDYMRRVSTHVTIGRAYKFHQVTNNYFLLCRDAR